MSDVTDFLAKELRRDKKILRMMHDAATAKRPTNTNFIQWLYMRDFGETLTTQRLERAYKEWQQNQK